MDIAALVSLFESYAVNLKAIGHVPDSERDQAFFNIDLENYQDALSRRAKPVVLILQTPDAEKLGKYDNMAERYDFSFVVLNHKPRTDKATIVSEAKAVADKIFNRFMAEADLDPDRYGIIEGTDEGMFGPVSDGVFGWAIVVSLVQPYDAEVVPEDWTDLDTGGGA